MKTQGHVSSPRPEAGSLLCSVHLPECPLRRQIDLNRAWLSSSLAPLRDGGSARRTDPRWADDAHPSGLRTGSPSSPPPPLIRLRRRLLRWSRRLKGPGPLRRAQAAWAGGSNEVAATTDRKVSSISRCEFARKVSIDLLVSKRSKKPAAMTSSSVSSPNAVSNS